MHGVERILRPVASGNSDSTIPRPTAPGVIEFTCNGEQRQVADVGASLLDALRDELQLHSVKDGCSPQGQCGCCTVLVDGQPRVSCVTPARRVRGRAVTTLEGLDAGSTESWADAFLAAGASQCGFCTPGIIMRLAGLEAKKPDAGRDQVAQSLAAHLCRCTGWNSIVDAWNVHRDGTAVALSGSDDRDLAAAGQRATLEGGADQQAAAAVALGEAGFADDTAPPDALIALRTEGGEWVVGETMHEARERSGKVQGRRTTLDVHYPLPMPDGDWDATLQTTWVEPGYLETDATWCAPGGTPASPLANGGAFGAKLQTEIGAVARRLADEHDRPVRVLYSREDSVRLGPKRPPLSAGIRADGTGIVNIARTAGIATAIADAAPGLEVVELDVAGPPTSSSIRGAGWVEATALLAAARGEATRVPTVAGAGWAEAAVADGTIVVRVAAGEPLDEIVLRSYCVGAAHMAFSLVCSEALSVAPDGIIHDLTIRSFGITRASEMPPVEVVIEPSAGPPVAVSDAVFGAVAAAVWLDRGAPPQWPVGL